MARIILISGKAEHGKTTVARMFKSHFESMGLKVTLTPFASYLKFIAKEHYGWNGQKDLAGRDLLQHIGTDVVRRKNPKFWVESTINFIDTFDGEFDVFIADDVRFPNEILAMNGSRHKVLTVKVTRLNFENSLNEEQRQHPSETALDDLENFDIQVFSESGTSLLYNEILNVIGNSDDDYIKSFFRE